MARFQLVCVGRTQSGMPGLFTNGFMAILLSEEEYALCDCAEAAARIAQRHHFFLAEDWDHRPIIISGEEDSC